MRLVNAPGRLGSLVLDAIRRPGHSLEWATCWTGANHHDRITCGATS